MITLFSDNKFIIVNVNKTGNYIKTNLFISELVSPSQTEDHEYKNVTVQ